MHAFPSARRRSRLPLVIIAVLIVIAALAAGTYMLWPRLESEPPSIVLAPDTDVLGTAPLVIKVADKGRGLKSLKATLSQEGTDHIVASETFDSPLAEKSVSAVLAKLQGLKEGAAVLRVTALDASLRGNETTVERKVTIDTTPPVLELIADDRYVNFGGVGVVVYKASPDTAVSGVRIGDAFFNGVPGQIKSQPDHWLAFFAHPYNVAPEVRPSLSATDRAGNKREMRLAYELKNVRYKKSTIAISDSFLANKVTPLAAEGAAPEGAAKEIFLAVNKRMRKENDDRIAVITGKVTPSILWSDAFAQLSNSKVEANFADQRTYTYGGEPIDTAYHLGYDLSVTKNYPVEAANSGSVAFTGNLGIYGNTVIVDHGLGLFTLYSHLNSIDVKAGDAVAKRQVLGKTGETGLAAGDHLHFGVYLSGVAVLPVEWWDQKWINDNIKPKLEGRSGQEIAEDQQPAKKARKTSKNRRR